MIKKGTVLLLMFFVSIILVGCGGESKEEKMYNELNDISNKFKSNTISGTELHDKAKSIYSNYCPDSDNSFCSDLDGALKEWEETKLDDCTTYADGSSEKYVCEATYASKKYLYENKDSSLNTKIIYMIMTYKRAHE